MHVSVNVAAMTSDLPNFIASTDDHLCMRYSYSTYPHPRTEPISSVRQSCHFAGA